MNFCQFYHSKCFLEAIIIGAFPPCAAKRLQIIVTTFTQLKAQILSLYVPVYDTTSNLCFQVFAPTHSCGFGMHRATFVLASLECDPTLKRVAEAAAIVPLKWNDLLAARIQKAPVQEGNSDGRRPFPLVLESAESGAG